MLKELQRLRLHHLSGQFVPPPDCPHGEKVSPFIPAETLMFQLMSIVSFLPTMHCCEEPVSVTRMTSVKALKTVVRSLEATSTPGCTSSAPSVSP